MAKKTRNKLRSAKRTGTPIGEEPEQGVSEVQAEILNGGKYNINANSEELEEGVYEVEAVVDHRLRKGGTEYKVRWKGWSQEHDEWLHHSRMVCFYNV
uniref:Chromo domain-containing protein n=1 Tax=Heterorhabditis bacteriophora TaxID=37862 RepID=A0A1I7WY17_HETBA